MTDQGPTAQQLILALRERGLSMRDLSAECDRDSSLLYQVAAGKRPGTNLLPTLIDLARTGHAARRPERRTTRSGAPARIRGRRGQPAHEPPPPTPTAPTPGQVQCADQLSGRRRQDEADHCAEVAPLGGSFRREAGDDGCDSRSCSRAAAGGLCCALRRRLLPYVGIEVGLPRQRRLRAGAGGVGRRLRVARPGGFGGGEPVVRPAGTQHSDRRGRRDRIRCSRSVPACPAATSTPQACQEGRREEGSLEGPAPELNLGQNGLAGDPRSEVSQLGSLRGIHYAQTG